MLPLVEPFPDPPFGAPAGMVNKVGELADVMGGGPPVGAAVEPVPEAVVFCPVVNEVAAGCVVVLQRGDVLPPLDDVVVGHGFAPGNVDVGWVRCSFAVRVEHYVIGSGGSFA